MNSISDYQIISAITTADLQKKVRDAIKKGWIPLGGITVAMIPNNKGTEPAFSQVMIK